MRVLALCACLLVLVCYPLAQTTVPSESQAVVDVMLNASNISAVLRSDLVITGRTVRQTGVTAPWTLETKANGRSRLTVQNGGQQRIAIFHSGVVYGKDDSGHFRRSVGARGIDLVVQQPLLLMRTISDKNTMIRYVGTESLGGQSVYHLQVTPDVQLSTNTPIDAFVDQQTGQVTLVRYPIRSMIDKRLTAVGEARLEDVRLVGPVVIPSVIQTIVNGTKVATTYIDSVSSAVIPNDTLEVQ